MFPDFKELLRSFHAHGVKYLVVEGYAVSFHSQPRATKDLDVFIRPDAENAKAVYDALAAFGAPMEGITIDDLADPGKFVRFGYPPVAIDILPAIDGVDFDGPWSRRIEGIIDQATGDKAFFISKEDLIASKLAAGRPRDLLDVEDIREAEK
jgi:hypothetical protein